MPQVADHHGVDGVAGGGPARGARDHGHGHAGPLRQRAGRGVRGGLRARVLAPQAGQVGAVQGRGRPRGNSMSVQSNGKTVGFEIRTKTCTS